jgi:hypothetical protein
LVEKYRQAGTQVEITDEMIEAGIARLSEFWDPGPSIVRGAVDGTALIADTTPTALPDLSSTDFELAPDFNGFLTDFRM